MRNEVRRTDQQLRSVLSGSNPIKGLEVRQASRVGTKKQIQPVRPNVQTGTTGLPLWRTNCLVRTLPDVWLYIGK